MRKHRINIFWLLLIITGLFATPVSAQKDSIPSEEVVKLHYFNDSNKVQYILLDCRPKTGKKFQSLTNRVYQLYLDSNRAENLITKVKTDLNGKAKAVLPPGLKQTWDKSSLHTFIVVAEGSSKEEEVTTEFEIRKSKISLDTSSEDGIRTISVELMKQVEGEWVPAPDVEMKVGVQRLSSILSAGDEATYTTDSSGKLSVEFKKDSLPGDLNGNIILIAKVDDDEQLGNLIIEKKAGWGKAFKPETDFFKQRTLWSTASQSPVWLLIMALSIIIGVWGTIFYLIIQIIKIKRLSISN